MKCKMFYGQPDENMEININNWLAETKSNIVFVSQSQSVVPRYGGGYEGFVVVILYQ